MLAKEGASRAPARAGGSGHFPERPRDLLERAAGSEDAFDVAVSALVMSEHERSCEPSVRRPTPRTESRGRFGSPNDPRAVAWRELRQSSPSLDVGVRRVRWGKKPHRLQPIPADLDLAKAAEPYSTVQQALDRIHTRRSQSIHQASQLRKGKSLRMR